MVRPARRESPSNVRKAFRQPTRWPPITALQKARRGRSPQAGGANRTYPSIVPEGPLRRESPKGDALEGRGLKGGSKHRLDSYPGAARAANAAVTKRRMHASTVSTIMRGTHAMQTQRVGLHGGVPLPNRPRPCTCIVRDDLNKTPHPPLKPLMPEGSENPVKRRVRLR